MSKGAARWLIVRQPAPWERRVYVADDGGDEMKQGHPEDYDVLIYHPDRRELSVHASSKAETKMYRQVVGQHGFGDADRFSEAGRVSLDPLRTLGRDALIVDHLDGLHEITLVEMGFEWRNQVHDRMTRQSDDLFETFSKFVNDRRHPGALPPGPCDRGSGGGRGSCGSGRFVTRRTPGTCSCGGRGRGSGSGCGAGRTASRGSRSRGSGAVRRPPGRSCGWRRWSCRRPRPSIASSSPTAGGRGLRIGAAPRSARGGRRVIPFQGSIRVFVALERVDMRKSFDGLAREVQRQLGRDPLAGHLYVFLGRNPKRMKMLLFDRHGFWIFYRRLEKGTFQLPPATSGVTSLEIDAAALAAILDGIDLRSIKRRVRYRRPASAITES